MIHIDAYSIQEVETGQLLDTRHVWGPGPSQYEPVWRDISYYNGWASQASIDRTLLDCFKGIPDPERRLWAIMLPDRIASSAAGWIPVPNASFTNLIVRKVRIPACECCGGNAWRWGNRPRRNVQKVDDGTWRCDRHVGRNPCFIEGCGKTRAGKQPSSDDAICGTHWRLAPRPLKLVDRRIWKIVRRHGWNDALARRYWRNWRRIVRDTRLVVHPPKVELELVAGPPPAVLLKELERLGL